MYDCVGRFSFTVYQLLTNAFKFVRLASVRSEQESCRMPTDTTPLLCLTDPGHSVLAYKKERIYD